MEAHIVGVAAVTAVSFALFWWVHRGLDVPTMSGDKWYLVQLAYTDTAVSAPYCWRPLLPYMARYIGFAPISFIATAVTPFVIYEYAGGGEAGLCCALLFIGNQHIFSFNIKNPEYVEGIGQLLFIGALWAMSIDSLLAWPLLLLCALCRETITAALGAICLFWNPWLLIPLAVGASVSYFGRREDKDNLHPLVEKTPHETFIRWMRVKKLGCLHYGHTLQPFRGTPLTVPFVWGQADSFARIGLLGLLPIWLLALPASGQSRIMLYGFGLIIPFVAACPSWAMWTLVFITWFIPFEVKAYNESGSETFGFAR